jgi:hypothetical protein
MKQQPDSPSKCSRCSVPILDGDPVLRDHGDWYHLRCARMLTSDERVTESRGLERASAAKIAQSQERLARASSVREEPPAVLCVICQTGIGSVAELAMTGSRTTHVRCSPASPTDPLR